MLLFLLILLLILLYYYYYYYYYCSSAGHKWTCLRVRSCCVVRVESCYSVRMLAGGQLCLQAKIVVAYITRAFMESKKT
jgi:hypothetical protein